jgi:hypothetical protein
MSTPKNKKEAERRLNALKEEYVRVRTSNPTRAKAIAKEIYALQEWQVANK